VQRDRLEARSLTWYLLYAFFLHVMFFGLAAFKQFGKELVSVNEIPVEMLVGVDKPAQKPEGGGEDKDEPPEPPPPDLAKQVPTEPVDVVPEPQPVEPVAEALEELTSAAEAIERVEPRVAKIDTPPPTQVVQQDRPRMTVASAVARASSRTGSYGLGRGRGGGRGGLGEGFGVQDKDLPVVSGGAVFGSNKRGAMKGYLCFIPVGTKRLSDIPRCQPEGIMYANVLNVTPRRFTTGFPGVSERFEWFAIDFKGKFSIGKEGLYKFRLHSDDGAILWINGQKVIDNDGLHPPQSKMGEMQLSEGKHRIRVLYFQGPRTEIALQLFVTPPGETERLFEPKINVADDKPAAGAKEDDAAE
jgi:hypothetical protein